MEAADGDVSDRRVVLDADEGIEPPLIEVVLDLVGQLPGVGEPEALRRTDGGLVRPLDAGDHNGAPLLGERAPVRGFGGGARAEPRASAAPAAAREAGGSKGGAASPRQSPVYVHWVGWPMTKSACRLRRSFRPEWLW